MVRVVTRVYEAALFWSRSHRQRSHSLAQHVLSKGLAVIFVARFYCKMADFDEKRWQSVVTFDLETTGLPGPKCEIIQLAAAVIVKQQDGTDVLNTFNSYILPKGRIERRASQVNHLRKYRGNLYFRKNKVETALHDVAINAFVEFLATLPAPVLLVAHNGMKFDGPLLTKSVLLSACHVKFTKLVYGMADTLPLYRDLFPGMEKYAQSFLVETFLPGSTFDAHNAIEDCRVLLDLVRRPEVTDDVLEKHMISAKKMICDALSKLY